MAYDEKLADRIREKLVDQPGIVEKKMFGGIGFLWQGNMACGVHKDYLIVRVGPERHQWAITQPAVKPFDITGRPMQGWVMVQPAGYTATEDLAAWVEMGFTFAQTLPPK